MLKVIFVFYSLLITLIKTTSPPEPEEPYRIIPEPAIMQSINNMPLLSESFLSKKRLQEVNADTIIEKSIVLVKFLEDNKIEEHHQIIFRAENLPSGKYYSSKNFIISLNEGQKLENIQTYCEKMEKSEDNTDNNFCEATISKLEDFYIFLYKFKLFNYEHIVINYSYNITKSTPEILYRQESVMIPDYTKAFCNYTFIIPEGYSNLGLQDNILTKSSENTFIYYDYCPSYAKTDIIRFTPKKSSWKATIGIFSELQESFSNDVTITFPKYYQGGKITERYYRIFSLENEFYKKSDITLNDLNYNVQLYAVNKQKIGIELYTAFTNNLENTFKLNIKDKYFDIDESAIDSTIKEKALRTVLDRDYYPGKPDYYKLGKFVHSYLTYNENHASKNFGPVEIYYLRAGASEHFTLLYNSLLNAINIKTVSIVGWAFKKDDTYGYNNTFNHTWTGALIDGKWIELDATWDLFEGVSSGHILKSFFNDKIYYSFNEKEGAIPSLEQISSIKMITNETDLIDPFSNEIEETQYIINTEAIIKEEKNHNNYSEKIIENEVLPTFKIIKKNESNHNKKDIKEEEKKDYEKEKIEEKTIEVKEEVQNKVISSEKIDNNENSNKTEDITEQTEIIDSLDSLKEEEEEKINEQKNNDDNSNNKTKKPIRGDSTSSNEKEENGLEDYGNINKTYSIILLCLLSFIIV